ncbi:MAG TPA: EDSAP-1 family PEP-CTERM protein [Pseudoduganella sp.]|jgi:hypothetical protein
MNMIKKGLLATAAAMTLGIGAMGSAYAATNANSVLLIENFRLLKGVGGAAFSINDFSVLSGTNDAHVTAQLNNTFSTDAGSVPILAGTGPTLGRVCVGVCPAGTATFAPVSYTGNFGSAAQSLDGTIIDLLTPPAGFAGANARTRADAATNSNMNIASGNSDVGTSTTFRFVMAAGTDMTFDFDATAYTDAAVSAGSSPTANANARLSWSVNIVDTTDGSTVFSFAPAALNQLSLRSATDTNPGTAPYNFSNHFGVAGDAATASGLLAGRTYQLTIQHNTLANVLQEEEVPEPATLAITAVGLLGMTLVSRRRKS